MTDDFQEIEGVRAPGDFQQAPKDDDPEARVEQLTSEIDDTRGDLTQTIEAIGEKLDPSNIAREATESVKGATLGKVEQMTYGAQETWRDVRTGNTGSIVDTITSNPIPAGMVALGIGMLFMNRGKTVYEEPMKPGTPQVGVVPMRDGGGVMTLSGRF